MHENLPSIPNNTSYEAIYVCSLEGNEDGGIDRRIDKEIFLENGASEFSESEYSCLVRDYLKDYLFTHEQISELSNEGKNVVVVRAQIERELSNVTIFSIDLTP